VGQLSPRELYERNLEGGILYLGPRIDMLSKALEMGFCSHKGSAVGKHGGILLFEVL